MRCKSLWDIPHHPASPYGGAFFLGKLNTGAMSCNPGCEGGGVQLHLSYSHFVSTTSPNWTSCKILQPMRTS